MLVAVDIANGHGGRVKYWIWPRIEVVVHWRRNAWFEVKDLTVRGFESSGADVLAVLPTGYGSL